MSVCRSSINRVSCKTSAWVRRLETYACCSNHHTFLHSRIVLANFGQIALDAVDVLHDTGQEEGDLTAGLSLFTSLSAPLQDHFELLRNVHDDALHISVEQASVKGGVAVQCSGE